MKDWHYVKAKGEELTEEEAYNIDNFEDFTNLYIMFELTEKPDIEKQIANKKQQKIENKKKYEKVKQDALKEVIKEKIKTEEKEKQNKSG